MIFVSDRNRGRFGVLATLLMFMMIHESSAQRSVRIAWDPNPETNIRGYRVYHGVFGANQTNVLDVGLQTTCSITNLAFGTKYWFYLTAYNDLALESDPSTVLTHTTAVKQPLGVKTDSPVLVLSSGSSKLKAELQGDVTPGSTVNVTWTQNWGPQVLSIQNSQTLQPSIYFETPGTYSLTVRASDGQSSAQKSIDVTVMTPQWDIPDGITPPRIEPPMPLSDGVAFIWNSDPDVFYTVVFKRSLNDDHWVLLEKNIPSQGAYTYWVTDQLQFLGQGFISVFASRN